ncbi:unnamed protein product [Paramecium primaurelia]|uniref:Tetratricopeptide repeat protein n=1 Tax=Paramecium primaurelia TaxID=5886 RepID=A0A8S1KLB6_PARPR|nr:unnamed protein product [Paramecium primaurelia]
MEIFTCKYIAHENEEIIGFCLNQNCQNATQYCYECLNTFHSDHFNDCIRFTKMISYINDFMQIYNKSRNYFNEIYQQLQNIFEQIFKRMDQEIIILENISNQLLNKDYLAIKSQINIIKLFYSNEKDKYVQQQISQLNIILETIKTMVPDQIKAEHQFNYDYQNNIKIEEINQEINDNMQQNNQDPQIMIDKGQQLSQLEKYEEAIECFDKAILMDSKLLSSYLNKGQALKRLKKYQEAIECYEKAIQINPKSSPAWNNKGNWFLMSLGQVLCYLKKYKEALQCYDIAIMINPQLEFAWLNKGNSLIYLKKYEDAIECFDKVISINPKNESAWNSKGLLLHKLKNFKDAIQSYDMSLSIRKQPSILKQKADSLFELGEKQLAEQFYKTALENGTDDTDQIQKQQVQL